MRFVSNHYYPEDSKTIASVVAPWLEYGLAANASII